MSNKSERPSGTRGASKNTEQTGEMVVNYNHHTTQTAPRQDVTFARPAQVRSLALPLYVPPELEKQDRWVNWRYELRDGNVTKPPVESRTGGYADSSRPETWGSLDAALTRYDRYPRKVSGIGFNQLGTDIAGGDLDDCIDDAGNLMPWAADIVSRFATYTEYSPSGRGIRMFGKGHRPGSRERTNSFPDVELYDGDSTRYLTFTGNHLPGTPLDVVDVTQPLAELYHRMFGAGADDAAPTPTRAAQPVNLDDTDLLARAIAAKNGGRFAALWSGDTSAHSSASEADYALVGALLFWTAGDEARVDRLFRASGLMRDKWDRQTGERTYGALTISKCASGQTQYFTPPQPRAESVTAAGEVAELPSVQDVWRILHAHITHDGEHCETCGRLVTYERETATKVSGGVRCFRCKRSGCMDWQNYRAKQLIIQHEPHTWPAHCITKLLTPDYDALVDGGLLRDVGQWFAVQSPGDVMTIGSAAVISSLSIAVNLETLVVTMAQAWLDRVWLVDDDGEIKLDKLGRPLRSRLRGPKNAARAKRETIGCDAATTPAPVVAAVDADPVIAQRKAAFGLIDLDPVDVHTLLDIIAAEGGSVDHKRRKWEYPIELKAAIRERVSQWAAMAGLDGRQEISAYEATLTELASISAVPLPEQPGYGLMTDAQQEYARRIVHRDANRESIEREVART